MSQRRRLKNLKPRIGTLDTSRAKRLEVPTPGATPRLSDRSGYAWAKIRMAVLRDEPLCRPCRERGIAREASQVDHIKPLELGGTDEWDNLQPICRPCHQAKSLAERARPVRKDAA